MVLRAIPVARPRAAVRRSRPRALRPRPSGADRVHRVARAPLRSGVGGVFRQSSDEMTPKDTAQESPNQTRFPRSCVCPKIVVNQPQDARRRADSNITFGLSWLSVTNRLAPV